MLSLSSYAEEEEVKPPASRLILPSRSLRYQDILYGYANGLSEQKHSLGWELPSRSSLPLSKILMSRKPLHALFSGSAAQESTTWSHCHSMDRIFGKVWARPDRIHPIKSVCLVSHLSSGVYPNTHHPKNAVYFIIIINIAPSISDFDVRGRNHLWIFPITKTRP